MKLKLTITDVLKIATSISGFVLFCQMSRMQYLVFVDEPTGSSLVRETIEDLPFPAISICEDYYEFRRAYEEKDFPKSAMMLLGGVQPSVVMSPPIRSLGKAGPV
jgi:hypothetical protein